MIGAAAIVVALGIVFTSVGIDPRSFSAAQPILPILLLWIVLAAMQYQLSRTPFRWRSELRELATRMQALIGALAVVTVFSTALVFLSYIASATSRPLMDGYLAVADVSIGFHWIRFVEWLNGNSVASFLLPPAYGSLKYQVLLVLAVIAFTSRTERLLEFAAAFGFAGGLTCAIQALVPAAGAVVFYNPPSYVLSSFGVGASTGHLEQLQALRTLEAFVITKPEGLVTFPSFHTTLALLFMHAVRGLRYVAPPVYLVNLLLIVSTIPVGGHFLVDVLAGVLVAATSILAVARFAGRTQPANANVAQSMRDPQC